VKVGVKVGLRVGVAVWVGVGDGVAVRVGVGVAKKGSDERRQKIWVNAKKPTIIGYLYRARECRELLFFIFIATSYLAMKGK